MIDFLGFNGNWIDVISILRTIVIIVFLFIGFNILLSVIKRGLLKKVRTKKQKSNIKIFSRVLKYIFFLILILFAISSYSGSWEGFGIGIGLFSAALGWALQKPITGVAAWIMLVTKRPFEIGDRIIVGKVRGDVTDMTLTHIYIQEVGGIVAGEESSGRIIMIPNSILFEKDITNYTLQDEYVLDQVTVAITYESNLDKAIKVIINATKKCMAEYIDELKRYPYVRTFFQPNGINVQVRYFAPTKRLQEFSSNITQEIFNKITKTPGVRIAYPHTEVILKK